MHSVQLSNTSSIDLTNFKVLKHVPNHCSKETLYVISFIIAFYVGSLKVLEFLSETEFSASKLSVLA